MVIDSQIRACSAEFAKTISYPTNTSSLIVFNY